MGIRRKTDCGINIARKYIIPTEVRTLSSHPGAIDVENLLVVVIGRVGWKPHLGTEKRSGGLLNSKTSLLRPDNQATQDVIAACSAIGKYAQQYIILFSI